MPRPTARVLRRVGAGFLLGAVGGWVAGLLRPQARGTVPRQALPGAGPARSAP